MSAPGTFLPVKADDTDDHRMQPEWGTVSAATADGAERGARRGAGGSSRSARRRCGCSKAPPTRTGAIRPFAGETSIFITPGYRFRAVDLLMTNFHLPRSTLFMLVSAFSGRETMLAAYRACDRAGTASILWRCCCFRRA